MFPAVALWINGGYGHIEIGDQEGFGFIARALRSPSYPPVRTYSSYETMCRSLMSPNGP